MIKMRRFAMNTALLRSSFASKVEISSLSFTPGFSPVIKDGMIAANRFNGLLFRSRPRAVL